MARIEKAGTLITLVNLFTVTPRQVDRAGHPLVRATENTMRHLPGFSSASNHRSIDGTR